MKRCLKCDEIKYGDQFYNDVRNKDGLYYICKVCSKITGIQYRQENKEELKLKRANYYKKNTEKLLSRNKKYQQENKEKVKNTNDKYRRAHRKEFRMYAATYRQKNPEKVKLNNERFNHAHPRYSSAKSARYKAEKRNQTPLDADKDKIEEFYKEAHILTKKTGIQYHVDHIMPISKGGLHHQDNLQVITATENLKKSNKIIDYPK